MARPPYDTSPSTTTTAEFDAYATTYATDVAEATAFARQDPAFYLELKARALVGLLDPAVDGAARVLDVGCGSGGLDTFVAPHVERLHGVDVAAEMVAQAARVNPSGDYQWYDGRRLPYDDASFDLVFTSCVLHHVPVAQRITLVAEMARATRAGGTVAILEHNPLNPLTRLVVSRCRFDVDAVLLSGGESVRLLRAAGLDSPHADYILFFPWRGRRFRRLEKLLARVPLGAQYMATATRT
jgi:SAM-dependent methyltransferase